MGRLTTHVLDTANGVPAAGIEVELASLRSDGDRVVAKATTNSDGRLPTPLMEGDTMLAGLYELRFAVGAYFRNRGPGEGFYETVPVRFRIESPEQHYHVPLLVSPFGYSTYRGS